MIGFSDAHEIRSESPQHIAPANFLATSSAQDLHLCCFLNHEMAVSRGLQHTAAIYGPTMHFNHLPSGQLTALIIRCNT